MRGISSKVIVMEIPKGSWDGFDGKDLREFEKEKGKMIFPFYVARIFEVRFER